MSKKLSRMQAQSVDRVYSTLMIIAALLLLVIAGLSLWANQFTTNMVRTELTAQKIYFPEKGTPALDPATYPGLQKYAGQMVDDAPKAKAYANEFIGEHLKHIANGKVYAEVSAEAMQNPSNEMLQKQRQSLFMGETLRSILLTTGYAYGTIGFIAGIISAISFASGILLIVLALGYRAKSN